MGRTRGRRVDSLHPRQRLRHGEQHAPLRPGRPVPPRPRVSTAPAPDVIVIGAGLVGTATALALAEAGARVTLVEGAFAGSGSTGAAMGHLVVMDDSPAQLALTAHSRRRWHTLAETLPPDAEQDRCGTLWIAADEAELQGAADRIAGYGGAGVHAELLTAAQLQREEPALRHGLAGALLVRDDAVCYPPTIARELLRLAVALGAVVLAPSRVQAIATGRVTLASGEVLQAGAIVVAAGVESPSLVPGLPDRAARGHLVITDRRPGTVHHQLVELGYLHSAHSFGGASVAFNVQPRRNGQLLIGSSRELVGTDPTINRPLVHAMLARATDYLPGLAQLRALRTWVGFRPATADKLPLIGPWPAIPGVWIAAGHEGLGITMAPGTADLIVAGLLGTTPPVDPAPFRPDRSMPALEAAA
ncbi:MAG: FAD-binding oxidoreductase [Gemmatimonadetes bacterium]|nr:FAD-binding oxidoreductase [Gemmatimonadota bacterium]